MLAAGTAVTIKSAIFPNPPEITASAPIPSRTPQSLVSTPSSLFRQVAAAFDCIELPIVSDADRQRSANILAASFDGFVPQSCI